MGETEGCHVLVHDARLFKNSSLYTSLCGGIFTPDDSVYDTINGVRVPPLILGDSAYPLQDWLMKPYVDRGNLSAEELQFNNLLSITRVVVENGYGRLKGRFPALDFNDCCRKPRSMILYPDSSLVLLFP